jgi:hypothetical protein
LIAAISLATDFSLLWIPFYGQLDHPRVLETFSLIFTSLMVFWFASVAPKKLAMSNPQVFLQYSRLLWPIIRWAAWDPSTAPSEWLVGYLSKRAPFNRKKSLAPSFAAYYEQSVRRYDFASDRLEQEIVIKPDGSCSIRQKGLLWILGGQRTDFDHSTSADSDLYDGRFHYSKVYVGPCLTEKRELLFASLDGLFDGPTATLGIEEVAANKIGVKGEFPDPPAKSAKWSIRCDRKLPEGLFMPGATNLAAPPTGYGALVMYEWELHGRPEAFNIRAGGDHWFLDTSSASRRNSVTIRLEGQMQFATPRVTFKMSNETHRSETERLQRELIHEPRTLRLDAAYPLPGGKLLIAWDWWRP